MAGPAYSVPTGGGGSTKAPPIGGSGGQQRIDPDAKQDEAQQDRGIKLGSPPRTPSPKGPAGGGRMIHAQAPMNWLQPLNMNQIQQQAQKMIKQAFAPAYADLNTQASRAQAIQDKRNADNQYYLGWLTTQTNAMTARAQAQDQQFTQMMQQMQQQQTQAFSTQGAGLVADANARAGNVSNNAQSSAFGSQLQQNQAFNQGMLATNQQQQLAGIQNQDTRLNSAILGNFSVIQADRMKQQSALDQVLQKIGDARNKLGLTQSADIAKEIGRLEQQNIAISENNRNFGLAAGRLGVSQYQAQTSRLNYQLGVTKAQQSQMNADRNYQLNVQKFNQATAKDIYERQHGLGPYKPSTSGQVKPLGTSSQNTIYNDIGRTTLVLNDLASKGVSRNRAYQILMDGGYQSTADAKGKTHWIAVPRPVNQSYLNAAINVSQLGAGLTGGDVAYLENLGLENVASRLKLASGVKND